MRFGWGLNGLRQVAPGADVVVLVDVLPDESLSAIESRSAIEALIASVPAGTRTVLSAGLTDRTAVARWIRARQAQKPGRFTVAIVAVGEPIAGQAAFAGVRFAVEDHFAAGALVDALAETGIDYHSPEAAAACASFTALRRGLRQLVRASAGGRALIARGRSGEVERATRLDDSELVTVLAESDDHR